MNPNNECIIYISKPAFGLVKRFKCYRFNRFHKNISHNQRFCSLIKSSSTLKENHKNLVPKDSNPHRLYGLPKKNKDNLKSDRFSNVFISEILFQNTKEIYRKDFSHVLNSSHNVSLVSNLAVSSDDVLVGSDVTSLFMNVHFSDSVTILKELLAHDSQSFDLDDVMFFL